jgi:hypothetical protein
MNETTRNHHLVHLEDYEQYVGAAAVDRILKKAEKLRGFHVVHVKSTYYGGGGPTMPSSLTSLMNGVGIKTGWRMIQGSPDFFGITKKIHNALQGGEINLTDRKMELGNVAADDPEGVEVYESLLGSREERIIILSVEDPALVNALQRRAAVVLRKSLRRQMGARGREVVKGRFLMSRLLEQYLDLFGSFETIYRLRPSHGLTDAVQSKA